MVFLRLFLIISIPTLAIQLLLPEWDWLPIVLAAIAGFTLAQKGFQAFMAGFLGLGLVWFGYSFIIDYMNASYLDNLVDRVSVLLGGIPSLIMIALTGLLGGLLGGLGSLAGFHLKRLLGWKA